MKTPRWKIYLAEPGLKNNVLGSRKALWHADYFELKVIERSQK
jgi:hypothetical protein